MEKVKVKKSKSADRIDPPGTCSLNQLDAFAELVLQGGQVRAAGLRERLAQARWLGFHYEDDELAAVAALKQPTDNYRDKVFRKAETHFPASEFVAELGWVFTRTEFRGRGISHRLLERLLEKAGQDNLFATTQVDNRAMQRLLKSLGFEQAGRPFPGTRKAHLLQLWVRCPALV
jgi:GNAT superfamily N-acetyltransferase